MPLWLRASLKALLLAISAIGFLSSGGFLAVAFLPLAVGYVWAVRVSGALERVGWIAVGSVAAALWVWIITYPLHDNQFPWSWMVAVGGGVAMAAALLVASCYRPRIEGPQSISILPG